MVGDPVELKEEDSPHWYRAPEVLMGPNFASTSIDMWSLGCMVAEVQLGRVLFPGTSIVNQLELIIQLLGRPTIQDLQSITHHRVIDSIPTQ